MNGSYPSKVRQKETKKSIHLFFYFQSKLILASDQLQKTLNCYYVKTYDTLLGSIQSNKIF